MCNDTNNRDTDIKSRPKDQKSTIFQSYQLPPGGEPGQNNYNNQHK